MSNIEILRDFKNGSFAIKCSFCNGTGRFPENDPYDEENPVEDIPCPVCKGKGINILKVDKERLFKCNFCGISGKSW